MMLPAWERIAVICTCRFTSCDVGVVEPVKRCDLDLARKLIYMSIRFVFVGVKMSCALAGRRGLCALSDDTAERFRRFVLPAALLAFFLGCSNQPPTYPVVGRVTFSDGEPVNSGTVEFLSAEHDLNARGKIKSDGSYVLSTFRPNDGAVAGRHRIIVVQHIIVETARPVKHGGSGHAHKPHRVVDRRYASYRNSTLSSLVSDRGSNVIDLEVESPPQESR